MRRCVRACNPSTWKGEVGEVSLSQDCLSRKTTTINNRVYSRVQSHLAVYQLTLLQLDQGRLWTKNHLEFSENHEQRRPHISLQMLGKESYLICSGVPPDVALVMAQAASFLVRNSAFWRISINTGKILASMTAWKRNEGGGWRKKDTLRKRSGRVRGGNRPL